MTNDQQHASATALYELARVAHDINSAYITSITGQQQAPFAELPHPHQVALVESVIFYLSHPEETPESSHAGWLNAKREAGWVHGADMDIDAKVDPRLVPYDELPQDQRTKDYLFKACVESLRSVYDMYYMKALMEATPLAPDVVEAAEEAVPAKFDA